MLPSEVRRKPKNASFDSREPTSPKVSCMGQVRFSNKKKRTKRSKPIKRVISLPTQLATVQVSCPKDEVKIKKPPDIIKGPKEERKSDVFYDDIMVSKQAVPSLCRIVKMGVWMRRKMARAINSRKGISCIGYLHFPLIKYMSHTWHNFDRRDKIFNSLKFSYKIRCSIKIQSYLI